ncbi:hypothetical protein ElyMa_006278800 [Elysia marginata]|uniref:BZIP domain-containing protein n=1 Tax=Elysia marginata TaxID=1093978 RepID=A0AAV4HF36_9GAST|nr:hypothetical protein ElyMa_006278800 [Elysia marginata]
MREEVCAENEGSRKYRKNKRKAVEERGALRGRRKERRRRGKDSRGGGGGGCVPVTNWSRDKLVCFRFLDGQNSQCGSS